MAYYLVYMPYYRRSKKTYRKRRRRRRNTPSSAVGPLAPKLKAKLIYHEVVSLSPGIGGLPDDYIFSANGVFDPNITASGHQPRGFDQLIALYDHCTVIGSKITMQLSNNDTENSNTVILSLRDNSTQVLVYDDIFEYRFIKQKTLGPETAMSTGLISMKCNPNRYLGKSSPLNNSDLRNSNSANPVEQAYFHINCVPTDGVTNSATVACQIRVEYDCIFTEPKQPNSS